MTLLFMNVGTAYAQYLRHGVPVLMILPRRHCVCTVSSPVTDTGSETDGILSVIFAVAERDL